MVPGMESMHTLPGRQGDEPGAPASDASVPTLVAALYDEAPTPLRVRLLNGLLRPVGPLALAAVAAGAFARLLPSERWSSVQVQLDDVLGIQAQQVLELALYVEQKAPELLWRLAETVATSPLALSTISGALLLMALRSRNHGTAPNDKR
jgi:hypothetical protein